MRLWLRWPPLPRTVVHLNGRQRLFYLTDSRQGIQNKISKSLIAHYCSYPLQLLEISLIVKSAFEIK